MTLSKLAKLANVSVSTASKAFSGSNEVNEQTRDMIFDVARENGCFKKFFNAKYPKFVVALICPEVHSRYYAELCFSIQRFLNAKNCEVCISAVGFSAQSTVERIEYYERYSSVDAIVLIDLVPPENFSHEIPIVNLGKYSKSTDISIVRSHDAAMEEAIGYLLSHGAKKIGFIGEKLTEPKREEFEIKAADFSVLDKELIYTSEKRFQEGGAQGARFFYEKGILPDALICAYDDMAFGCVRFLSDVGINVPRDISVIGMDNTPNAEFFCPRLSSIGFEGDTTAESVANGILELFSGEKHSNTVVELAASFYPRESSEGKA